MLPAIDPHRQENNDPHQHRRQDVHLGYPEIATDDEDAHLNEEPGAGTNHDWPFPFPKSEIIWVMDVLVSGEDIQQNRAAIQRGREECCGAEQLSQGTVVFKPAKFGVLLIRPLLEAFRDSFPAGVINVIYGSGRETVSALMASGKVDIFAFIGTNNGASALKKLHPRPQRLRTVLGLDAKNPGIVLPEVDLDNAVNEAVTGSLSFNGQRCTALKILFVHEDVVDQFLEKFNHKLASLKPGMPWEPGVALTPLPEPR